MCCNEDPNACVSWVCAPKWWGTYCPNTRNAMCHTVMLGDNFCCNRRPRCLGSWPWACAPRRCIATARACAASTDQDMVLCTRARSLALLSTDDMLVEANEAPRASHSLSHCTCCDTVWLPKWPCRESGWPGGAHLTHNTAAHTGTRRDERWGANHNAVVAPPAGCRVSVAYERTLAQLACTPPPPWPRSRHRRRPPT